MSHPIRFKGFVASARFSPDGKWEVTAEGDDKMARVWDVKTGEPHGDPMVSEGRVNSACFSADGKRVLTASSDGTARVWEAGTGKPLGEPMRHSDDINSADFSPDGKWVVTASVDKTARVWDAETGKPLGEPMVHEDAIRSASFSPDGKRVLTASDDKTARVWDAIIKSEAATAWISDLAEAAGGLKLTPMGSLEPSEQDCHRLGEELRHLTGDDDLTRFGRWYVADPATRTISPLSTITVPEFVQEDLKENSAASVEEAYEIDSGNPVILVSLARFEDDKDEALFLCRYALRRARIEGPPEKIEQVRSTAKSIFPDLPEFSEATKAPSPNTH